MIIKAVILPFTKYIEHSLSMYSNTHTLCTYQCKAFNGAEAVYFFTPEQFLTELAPGASFDEVYLCLSNLLVEKDMVRTEALLRTTLKRGRVYVDSMLVAQHIELNNKSNNS